MGLLIFDFDGTLADTFFIAVGVFRKLARRARSKHPTDDEEVEILRGLPALQVLKRVGVHWWQIPYIVYEGRKAVQRQMPEVKVISGIEDVLQELHRRGYKLMVVSTNSQRNIDAFLKRSKLESCFDGVYGGIGLFAKARTIEKVMREHKADLSHTWYIGDEVRDVDAARKAGVQCISVAWGYNSRPALERAHAEIIIEHPKELLDLVGKKKK